MKKTIRRIELFILKNFKLPIISEYYTSTCTGGKAKWYIAFLYKLILPDYHDKN